MITTVKVMGQAGGLRARAWGAGTAPGEKWDGAGQGLTDTQLSGSFLSEQPAV